MQTGGEIRSTPTYARPMIIGFAGGEGEFVVSNGVTTATTDVYVGGAPTNSYGNCDFNRATSMMTHFPAADYSMGGAVGRLVVAADSAGECSFTALGSQNGNPGYLIVGTNGVGEVEVGAGGSLTVNGATFAGSSATLRCTLGASSAGTFRVAGEMVVGDGARLVVDASKYSGQSWVKIVNADSRTGSFSDIEVIGGGAVVQSREGDSSGSIWYRAGRGAILTIK